MNKTRDSFLKAITKIERFSPAPRVLGQAMTLLRDADAEVDEITSLIKTDTALTTDIIRGANSAFYGAGERVSSLDRAVQKIGFSECIRLLNFSVARTLAARDLVNYGIASEDYWAESLFNGLFMECLARETRALDPDTAHTAGLLRYVGRLAINECLTDLGLGLFWDGHTPMRAWEVENVGFPQTEAAAHLLRAWNFSDEISSAIEFQDDPGRATNGDNLLAALHFTASVLPEGMGLSYAVMPGEHESWSPESSRFVTDHGITAEFTKELLDRTRIQFSEINDKLYA